MQLNINSENRTNRFSAKFNHSKNVMPHRVETKNEPLRLPKIEKDEKQSNKLLKRIDIQQNKIHSKTLQEISALLVKHNATFIPKLSFKQQQPRISSKMKMVKAAEL